MADMEKIYDNLIIINLYASSVKNKFSSWTVALNFTFIVSEPMSSLLKDFLSKPSRWMTGIWLRFEFWTAS